MGINGKGYGITYRTEEGQEIAYAGNQNYLFRVDTRACVAFIEKESGINASNASDALAEMFGRIRRTNKKMTVKKVSDGLDSGTKNPVFVLEYGE